MDKIKSPYVDSCLKPLYNGPILQRSLSSVPKVAVVERFDCRPLEHYKCNELKTILCSKLTSIFPLAHLDACKFILKTADYKTSSTEISEREHHHMLYPVREEVELKSPVHGYMIHGILSFLSRQK